MNLDNFREWLSDNLRYIMLGAGILIILTGLFLGIRAVSGLMKGDSTTEVQQPADAEDNKGNNPSSPTDGELSEKNDEIENPLEHNQYPEVNALIASYYNALGSKDTQALKETMDVLDPEEEIRIQNAKYIEGYKNLEVYTKKGLEEDSYVVYSCYDYICTGITTPVPAMSQIYVETDGDGQLRITADTSTDAVVTKYLEEDLQTEDVQALWNQVNEEYEKAKASDADLAAFLDGLGTESSPAEAVGEGAVLTAKETCNIREAADGESEVIGSVSEGETVTKLGLEGEWVKVDYEGLTGYIHSELLR